VRSEDDNILKNALAYFHVGVVVVNSIYGCKKSIYKVVRKTGLIRGG
jgi:hypothetical protein